MDGGGRVMWVDFGNSTIVPGLDRTSPAAQIERQQAELAFIEADDMLAYHQTAGKHQTNVVPVAEPPSSSAIALLSGKA